MQELVDMLKICTGDIKEAIPCDECGEDSTCKITFLLENYRNNRGSNAYGQDDCSWIEDKYAHACNACQDKVRRNPPSGHVWVSIFDGKRFPHMITRSVKPDIKEIRSLIAKYDKPT